ncbi:hypothetical protein HT031_006794 [Scenedesmus sp. PABB004]|nr:hypothetical protein HT031_006794 [Scenedesmus sp. PABB004]
MPSAGAPACAEGAALSEPASLGAGGTGFFLPKTGPRTLAQRKAASLRDRELPSAPPALARRSSSASGGGGGRRTATGYQPASPAVAAGGVTGGRRSRPRSTTPPSPSPGAARRAPGRPGGRHAAAPASAAGGSTCATGDDEHPSLSSQLGSSSGGFAEDFGAAVDGMASAPELGGWPIARRGAAPAGGDAGSAASTWGSAWGSAGAALVPAAQLQGLDGNATARSSAAAAAASALAAGCHGSRRQGAPLSRSPSASIQIPGTVLHGPGGVPWTRGASVDAHQARPTAGCSPADAELLLTGCSPMPYAHSALSEHAFVSTSQGLLGGTPLARRSLEPCAGSGLAALGGASSAVSWSAGAWGEAHAVRSQPLPAPLWRTQLDAEAAHGSALPGAGGCGVAPHGGDIISAINDELCTLLQLRHQVLQTQGAGFGSPPSSVAGLPPAHAAPAQLFQQALPGSLDAGAPDLAALQAHRDVARAAAETKLQQLAAVQQMQLALQSELLQLLPA